MDLLIERYQCLSGYCRIYVQLGMSVARWLQFELLQIYISRIQLRASDSIFCSVKSSENQLALEQFPNNYIHFSFFLKPLAAFQLDSFLVQYIVEVCSHADSRDLQFSPNHGRQTWFLFIALVLKHSDVSLRCCCTLHVQSCICMFAIPSSSDENRK